ncbi:MAG TPA: Ig-like domain-containing protein [Verrucomicrobiae bacterium]|nr:Ig-like domain-containing protein [Verrucomicrobiae bacterium]
MTAGIAGTNLACAADDIVDFGAMKLGRSRAFSIPQLDPAKEIPVAKHWLAQDGRSFLIESTPVSALKDAWQTLPTIKPTPLGASQNSRLGIVSAKRALPLEITSRREPRQLMADASPTRSAPGVVLDYVILTSQSGYTFRGDTTYYVSGTVNLGGQVTFEGGAVIKYTNNASLNFDATTVWNWLATSYRPVIFTSKDDGSVGQAINGSLTSPPAGTFYANPAISFTGSSSAASYLTMDNFRIAYAQRAISASGISIAVTLRNGQIVNCPNCFYTPGQASVFLGNMLFANFTSALVINLASVSAQNVTFDGQIPGPSNGYQPAFLLLPAYDPHEMWLNLENCILSHIVSYSPANAAAVTGDYNGFYSSATAFGVHSFLPSANPFQTKGAGNYYLTNISDGSGLRQRGTTAVDGTLLGDLAVRTTFPPVNPPAPNPMGATWLPVVSRDNPNYNGGSPDLGYHYDPLDYWTTQYQVYGAPLIITNGVAIGFYGSSGFLVQGGGGLTLAGGGPFAMNRLVWYPGVQEQPIRVSSISTYASPLFNITSGGYGGPHIINLNFTDIPMEGGRESFFDFGSPGYFPILTAKNSWLRGVNLTISPALVNGTPISSVTLWNNLLERCTASFFNGYVLYYYGTGQYTVYQNPLSVIMYNNLLWSNSISLTYEQSQDMYSPGWTIKDNLFDGSTVSFTGDGTYLTKVDRSHNGYNNSPSGSLAGAGDVTLSSLSYATSTFGPWYEGSSTPTLVDAGSRSAESAGLMDYTTQANQTPEGCSTVDIGFHYVALDSNGNPIDSNFDGIPDFLQPTIFVSPPSALSVCMNNTTAMAISASGGCGTLVYTTSGPHHGTISPSSGAAGITMTYTPAHNYYGSDNFTFTVSDGVSSSGPFNVPVSVLEYAPTANPQNITACVSTSLPLTLDGSSPCNEPLTVTVTSGPSHGTLSPLSGASPLSTLYTPTHNYVGSDSFTFTVSDGVLTSSPATVSIMDGDQPQADDKNVQTCKNVPVAVTLTGSEISPCSDPLSFVVVTSPAHGTLSGSSPNLTYTPASGFTGNDSFTYKAMTSLESSATATVSIVVGAKDISANAQELITGVNHPINITLTAQDPPENCSPLTYSIVSGPTHGTLTGSGTSRTYTPNSGFEGLDTFTFSAADGVWNAQADISIYVVAAPVLTGKCRSDHIILSWTVDTFVQGLINDGTIESFNIYRSTVSGGPYTFLTTVSATTLEYVDAAVSSGTTYCYVITMVLNDPNTGIDHENPYSNQVCLSLCAPPNLGKTDVAFIVDNTSSMRASLGAVQTAITSIIKDISAASGGDYRLALVTPDENNDGDDGSFHDMVVVRFQFTDGGTNAFITALNNVMLGGGSFVYESTDQCLNTVVNSLSASTRSNDDGCTPASPLLQQGDFAAFRSTARKLVVLITDAAPSGFCDSSPPTATQAHSYAVTAKGQCIAINAIQLGSASDAIPIMQDYATTSCGWYTTVLDRSSIPDLEDAVVTMLYTSGQCPCP